MDERFWRLLGACELLSRDEIAALTHRNIPALVRTQEVKSAILADLAAQAGMLHASCDSRARARLGQLLEGSRQNARAMAEMIASASNKKQEIKAALSQLNRLRARYKTRPAATHKSFSAHG